MSKFFSINDDIFNPKYVISILTEGNSVKITTTLNLTTLTYSSKKEAEEVVYFLKKKLT